jgi:hypothetical protein
LEARPRASRFTLRSFEPTALFDTLFAVSVPAQGGAYPVGVYQSKASIA